MNNQNLSTRSQLYWNTLIRIPSQIISVVILIFIARILDPKDFGIMAIVMMLIGYSNLLTNFGFIEAVIQKRIHDKKILNSIFTFDLAISSFLAFVFFILSGSIADFFKTPECKEVIQVMNLVFIVTSFTGIPTAILKRDMNFQAISLFDITSSLLMAFITLVLALNHFDYWALAYGQLIPLIVITISLCIKTRWVPIIYYNHSLIMSIIHFGVWNFIKTQLGFIAKHTDKFIIGRWLGSNNLGFYDKAMSISVLPVESIAMNINAVMFSSFSNNQDKQKTLQTQFKKSLTLISIIHFPIYFGMIAIAPYLVHVLLGDQWIPMIVPFQILLLANAATTLGGITSSLNVAMGNYKQHTLLYFLSYILFTLCCFILLPFGLNGISVSYLIFMVVVNLLTMQLAISKLYIHLKDIMYSIVPGLLGSLIMFFTIKILSSYYFEGYSFSNLSALIIIGIVVYVSYLFIDRTKSSLEIRTRILADSKNVLMTLFNKREYSD